MLSPFLLHKICIYLCDWSWSGCQAAWCEDVSQQTAANLLSTYKDKKVTLSQQMSQLVLTTGRPSGSSEQFSICSLQKGKCDFTMKGGRRVINTCLSPALISIYYVCRHHQRSPISLYICYSEINTEIVSLLSSIYFLVMGKGSSRI